MPSVLWCSWLGGRKASWVKSWVMGCWHCYLSRARCRLAYAQLMPLPLTVSCFSKIQIGFTFQVLAHPGSPRQRAVKTGECVCYVCNMLAYICAFAARAVVLFLGSLTVCAFVHACILRLACRQFLVYFFSDTGYELPCHAWSLINRFQAGLSMCRANLHKWGPAQSPSCDCGQWQTMNHIVDTCPLTKFDGGLNLLHKVDDDIVIWWLQHMQNNNWSDETLLLKIFFPEEMHAETSWTTTQLLLTAY